MSDLLTLFKTFSRVVEAGSFTAVAEERNTSQPTISRQIASLEEHLGCLLFQRTTRSLTLTDDGRILYEHAVRTLEAAREAEGAVGRRRGKPGGLLRLSCAVTLGRMVIVPRLERFLNRFPDITLDLFLNDGISDLVEEGIDLAIRVGEVTDPSLIARRIGLMRRAVVAASSYVRKKGTPLTPHDLKDHDCIVYSRLAASTTWSFERAGETISVPVKGRYQTNSTEGNRAGIINGLGIGFTPIWQLQGGQGEADDIVVLLKDYEPMPLPISAVYPSKRFLAPKVRVMIDYLAGEFELDPILSSYGL
jgi:DNA-binding transcriptional LysR family regulator